jgi:hypothetical protein
MIYTLGYGEPAFTLPFLGLYRANNTNDRVAIYNVYLMSADAPSHETKIENCQIYTTGCLN